ncbi:MAG: DNA-directed RNA polymerase subunit beta', partial [Melioribacteraceae bacterium]|nr:DNA-directed RNA polymerase subunit beta' [Melioribacteraceae bacterium]
NFKEGLSVLEYFISTHGARKGLADTALKTADAGYLTRRLTDVAQEVIISQVDCGTIRGVDVSAIKDVELEREPLAERITGRVAQEDIYDPRTDEVIVDAGELITEESAEQIDDASIDSVFIRTALTCESKRGICAKCYGRNLTTGHLVEIGEAVGIIAAQSIGEPGTQLTLRTFHLGGTSSRIASQSQVESSVNGKVVFEKMSYVERKDFLGNVMIVTGRRGSIGIFDEDGRQIKKYDIPYGAVLLVEDNELIKKGQPLYNHDPYNAVILTDIKGTVRYVDLIEKSTLQQVADEQTGHVQKVVIESKDKTLTPSIVIADSEGNEKSFNLPTGAYLSVEENTTAEPGTILAKISKSASKSRDITGGLPRVTELFEARSPVDSAVVSEIEGIVKFGAKKKGSREIIVESLDGMDQQSYSVNYGKHILVQEGDEIPAGEKITDGPIDPHDILKISGTNAVQEYLVNEIQDVYRLQGVKLNDKHIEVIVRQMLRKLRIITSGDTSFIEEDLVHRVKLIEQNADMMNSVFIDDPGDSKYGKGEIITRTKMREENSDLERREKLLLEVRDAEPATFDNVLLGITQAALSTESFISAASFQETTKVLTNAAIAAKVDNLIGLKENVVMGGKIPAGTGLRKYNEIILSTEEAKEETVEEDQKIEEKA